MSDAKARIEQGGGEIVIRLSIDALPRALEGACVLGYIDGDWIVTDKDTLAKEIVYALNDEDEVGTTPVHRLFDQAFNATLERGGEGINEKPEDTKQ